MSMLNPFFLNQDSLYIFLSSTKPLKRPEPLINGLDVNLPYSAPEKRVTAWWVEGVLAPLGLSGVALSSPFLVNKWTLPFLDISLTGPQPIVLIWLFVTKPNKFL